MKNKTAAAAQFRRKRNVQSDIVRFATARGYDIIAEGKARVAVPKYSGKAVSSQMPVFYNPAMRSNRDITVLLLAAAANIYGIKKFRAADPMAATGVRGIRLLLELGKSVEAVAMNDYSYAAANLIRKNLKLNRLKEGKKAVVTQNEANKFLLNSPMFSYIDIDPFGYPGIFLDTAVKRIRHNGMLAVTATDTSALAGSAVAACRRKYIATPLKNGFMHETGTRILIRLAQLIGAIHGKAMVPVFSYYKDHYIRAFFLAKEGAGKADGLLKMHKEIAYCGNCCEKKIGEVEINLRCGNCGTKMLKVGPLWAGKLFDTKLAAAMDKIAAGKAEIGGKTKPFLTIIAEEARIENKTGVGFYELSDVCSRHKAGQQPKTSEVIKRLRQKGWAASQTHCTSTGVKTNAPIRVVMAAVKGI